MSVATSFIIPSYNSLKTLPKTIESILAQQAAGPFEIVVVDSSDDEMAKKYLSTLVSDQIKVIVLEQKTIPAQSRNIGARAAKGELLCFIDSDVILADDWLKEIIAAYTQGCRAGGGAIGIPDFQKNNTTALAQLYLQFNEYLTESRGVQKLFVPSCNMFCERKLFEQVGGFPDIRASEDTLFFLQLQNKAPVYFIPQAKCRHIFREGWEGFLRNQFLLGKYVSIYRRQYYKSIIYKGIAAILLSPAFLTIKFLRIVARVATAGPSHLRSFLKSSPVFVVGFIWWSTGFINGFIESDGNPKS